ncbi:hypothetical protein ACS91_27740 [Vibrio parahaemolyticus]|uniref:hypothetical protein n=1 Tax=Vibrio parahaemolyticus TaxID=670 RepID=UPI0006A6016C|nr:hypothetical protein ACS91_27740 [Vibrio parahaemolyticus]
MKKFLVKNKKPIVILGLLVAPFLLNSLLKSNHKTPISINLLKKVDGIYVHQCKGLMSDDLVITASHCFTDEEDQYIPLYIHSDTTFYEVMKPFYVGKYTGLTGSDIAFSGKYNTELIGVCEDHAYTASFMNMCNITPNGDGSAYYSDNCVYPKGMSGTVLVNKNQKACLVYSGFYDIIDKNKNSIKKIGVFKPLKGIKNEYVD